VHSTEKYAGLRGDRNPMCRPEVAAKQAETLRQTLADPAKRAAMKRNAVKRWTPEQRAAQAQRAQQLRAEGRLTSPKWTEERKQEHSQRMQAYWAKVRAALAVVGESQHGTDSTT
jgi:hypothetical protein